MKPTVNYSLYLVTSSTQIAPGSSLEKQVEEGIIGGVTLVQLREKDISTKLFLERAKSVLNICRKHGVPLLINDRIDIALAIGAEGVHIGQDDMDCKTARKILGEDSIIGVSTNNIHEVDCAAADGADYVGIGSIYDTNTKNVKERIIGITGLREILEHMSKMPRQLNSVAIAGLNSSNIQRVIYLSEVNGKRIDGIALVSAIMSSTTPLETAKHLRHLIVSPPCFAQIHSKISSSSELVAKVGPLFAKTKDYTPLIHHLTNGVAKNFSANVTLAVNASPTMGESKEEVADFAKFAGSLVLNIGTLQVRETLIYASQIYNSLNRPVVLDPVGVGATKFRTDAISTLLNHAYFDIIKGNEGEIMSIAGEEGIMRGVDSVSQHTLTSRVSAVQRLAVERRCVVAMSGQTDIVSDGKTTYIINNGTSLLGKITASGCSLGSVMGVAVSLIPEDKLLAAVSATLLYNIAGELAVLEEKPATSHAVQGPGTFLPVFIDKLYFLVNQCINGDYNWLNRALIQKV
ncbi:thiamine-phosphate dipyrophosphorylase/hydroxyethylthiazole kinase [Schizosaccharomyces cryophilus OY26]|uniref:Thiamine-phosphate dipyrophosphorylase/hydroxyethylthiazole kinase n=1 Tax=Schizosaccharomyces cryophilus (strain OY26 / ATCC MYA-4695 / CBS 11777 / NBRC 106824 / NRRL Y48691) TaxID=653667 RepID=S9VT16_SCHCR|nr:thiamine-phosphate dipyrophosphorylase/hydroxyethylthiazole kinase [Schizosaccharomyces cryophilus OY26]EPY51018.1 thiamine-phosphate dipyrophosphorylase/hydroxyethylthiazole kinase [Schizosaccharomyces cryophilus OY26]